MRLKLINMSNPFFGWKSGIRTDVFFSPSSTKKKVLSMLFMSSNTSVIEQNTTKLVLCYNQWLNLSCGFKTIIFLVQVWVQDGIWRSFLQVAFTKGMTQVLSMRRLWHALGSHCHHRLLLKGEDWEGRMKGKRKALIYMSYLRTLYNDFEHICPPSPNSSQTHLSHFPLNSVSFSLL